MVTISSPGPSADCIASASRRRFCCGRIIMKYMTPKSRTIMRSGSEAAAAARLQLLRKHVYDLPYGRRRRHGAAHASGADIVTSDRTAASLIRCTWRTPNAAQITFTTHGEQIGIGASGRTDPAPRADCPPPNVPIRRGTSQVPPGACGGDPAPRRTGEQARPGPGTARRPPRPCPAAPPPPRRAWTARPARRRTSRPARSAPPGPAGPGRASSTSYTVSAARAVSSVTTPSARTSA